MTPLADALRRIALRPHRPGPLQRETDPQDDEAPVTTITLDAASPLPTMNVDTTAVCGDSAVFVSETVTSDTACVLADEKPHLPRCEGKIHLLADLVGDPAVIYRVAAQQAANTRGAKEAIGEPTGMVVRIRPGAAPTGPILSARTDQAEAFRDLRWPIGGTLTTTPWELPVPQAALPLGSAGMANRDWVLFLDRCRHAFDAVSIVVPAACTSELAWFANRCDTIRLVALAGATSAAAARLASLRLSEWGGMKASCLLVEIEANQAAA